MTALDFTAMHGLSLEQAQMLCRPAPERLRPSAAELATLSRRARPGRGSPGPRPRVLAWRILGLCALVSLSLPVVERTRMPSAEELRGPLRGELARVAAMHARLGLWPTLEELPSDGRRHRWVRCEAGEDVLELTGRRLGAFKTAAFRVTLSLDSQSPRGDYQARVQLGASDSGGASPALRLAIRPDEAGLIGRDGARLTRRRILEERCSRRFGHDDAIRALALELTRERAMSDLRAVCEVALGRHPTRWWPRLVLLWLDISEGRCDDLPGRLDDLAAWLQATREGIRERRIIQRHARRVAAFPKLDTEPQYRLHSEDAAVLARVLGGSIASSAYHGRSVLVEAPR